MSGNKTEADRKQYVVKANDLIRKTRYDMTPQQQKIILFAISKIKPDDQPTTEYKLDIDELCKACGIELNSGYYYKSIKDDIAKLTTRIWVKMPDDTEQTVSWIGDAKITPFNRKVSITFHKAMSPYLFDLHQRYTQYHLEDVLVLKSKYSIRLYEILRSYTTQNAIDNGIEKEVMFSVSELREMLDVDGYPRWAEFDRCVIKKAVDEINACNDVLHISYNTYTDGGRNIEKVNFIIGFQRFMDILKAREEKRRRL